MINAGILLCLIWLCYTGTKFQFYLDRERSRGHKLRINIKSSGLERLDQIIKRIALRTSLGYKARPGTTFDYATFASPEDRARFLLFQAIIVCSGVGCAALSYKYLETTYAVLFVAISGAAALLIPFFALKSTQNKINRTFDRDYSQFSELVHFAVVSGMELEPALDTAAALLATHERQGIFITELEKARAVASRGYAWTEALDTIADKLHDDSVQRCCRGLRSAIRSPEDRRRHIEQVAEEARKVVSNRLEVTVAKLPTKTFILTFILLLGCFSMALAPVAVQVKESVVKAISEKN